MLLTTRKIRQSKSLVFMALILLASTVPNPVSAQAPVQTSNLRTKSFLPANSVQQATDIQIITASTASILSEVVRKMEPALEDFLTTFSFTKLTPTIDKLEFKYRSKKLNIDYNFSDNKLFVAVKLSGKRFCYRATTPGNRIKLVKSTRCA